MRLLSQQAVVVVIGCFLFFPQVNAQVYNRGVGVYPGNPNEVFAPSLVNEYIQYRNLALHRAAYQSSSYDYNLTAQLVTDGIRERTLPGWIATRSNEGIINKRDRECTLDHQPMSRQTLEGQNVWLQVEMKGSSLIPRVDSAAIMGSLLVDSLAPKPWKIVLLGSHDGTTWEPLDTVRGSSLPGDTVTGFFPRFPRGNLRNYIYSMKLHSRVSYGSYKVECQSPNAKSWSISEFALFSNGKRAIIGGPYSFASAWKSAGNGEEWVSIDLGSECSFDRVVLYWIKRAIRGAVQVSRDGTHWHDAAQLTRGSGEEENIVLKTLERGRYVRLLMEEPESPEGYILSEVEVYGRGGVVPIAHNQAPQKNPGQMMLSGGAWKLQRSSEVHANGETLSRPGYQDFNWIVATVPGTILTSFLNTGALPDPDVGNNQELISDSFFYSDFWYRDEFIAPSSFDGRRTFLHFNGIDWKAEVFLNGRKLGRIEGAFMRGAFDVTDILVPGELNALAVRIIKNETPGFVTEQSKFSPDANGGEIGADNPTFHASIGWDWIPTIRGRNTGIWSTVYLTATGPITIEDPFVSTRLPLPDTSAADVFVQTTINNHSSKRVSGVLRVRFGDTQLDLPVTIEKSERRTLKLDPSTQPSLHLQHPRLWWPNGYGEQILDTVSLRFVTADGLTSDSTGFLTGVREMTYSEEGGNLKIWVNGKRFVGKGGNWGFPESMLRYRAREYDVAVRYHQDMNFTMIRNWVGQTGDDEFFDACDRHGIMVWQDFWLANPLDGPEPNDNGLFMQNVEDFVKRIRNHPSIGLYCGRNEGNPPAVVDSAIRKLLPLEHPGLHYISNSASGVVSGGGPYRMMPVKFYFERRATEKLHSEIGMPSIVSMQSLRRMLPDSSMWPMGDAWGLHDFCLEGAQGAAAYIKQMEDSFGRVDSLNDWLLLSQWLDYNGYRAMFEAQSRHRMGLLLWMSHSAWPSLVWQTYDYYFEPAAAYFACKKACEPLHIQWNAASDSIEVVNYSAPVESVLSATLELLNADGSVVSTQTAETRCPEDTAVRCFKVQYPAGLTSVYFMRLRLNRGGTVVSENLYWRGIEEGNLKALRSMAKTTVSLDTQPERQGSKWIMTTLLRNAGNVPALMVRLSVLGEKSKQTILPVIFSDNFILLMPGEQRTIRMELDNADTMGEIPVVALEGLNVK